MQHPSFDPAVQARREAEFAAAQNRYQVDQLQARWQAEDAALLAARDWRTQEVAELRRRVGALGRQVGPQGPLLKTICRSVAGVLGDHEHRLADRIDALEKQEPGLVYRGVWTAGADYARGAMVTHSGGAWIATQFIGKGLKPGDGETGWRLAIKSSQAGLKRLVEDEVRRQLTERPVLT